MLMWVMAGLLASSQLTVRAEQELVLIFGGQDENGNIIEAPEVFSGKSQFSFHGNNPIVHT